jgi:hypothetical protein
VKKVSTMASITAMVKHKSFTVELKHSILEWIYEDEDNQKTSYAAEQHF